jgi:hypothetical protein
VGTDRVGSAWVSALDSLAGSPGPAPHDGALRVALSCRTSRDPGAKSRRHGVVIEGDWSVQVPHDLAAERVAAALGGYLSCISLVDDAVPALRVWLRGMQRAEVPRLKFWGSGGDWRPEQPESCCRSTGFASAAAAAGHLRSATHVARSLGTDPRQLQTLVGACQRAHAQTGTLAMAPADVDRAATGCVKGVTDVVSLWEAGIHPLVLAAIRDEMRVEGRLPARFYLGVVSRRPDLRWVADTIAAAAQGAQALPVDVAPEHDEEADDDEPEAEPLVSWLAWSVQDWDQIDPTARSRWLATGVTRPLVLVMGEAGYDPDVIVAYAHAVGRRPDSVARTLRRWLEAGFDPDVNDLIHLAEVGISSHYVPSVAAVQRLRVEAGSLAGSRNATDLALLLCEKGTVGHAVAALRGGGQRP